MVAAAAVESGGFARRSRFGSVGSRAWILLLPSLILLLVLFIYPLGRLTVISLTVPEFGLHNYIEALTSPLVWRVMWITFQISIIVTVICLLLGYVLAYVLVHSTPGWRRILFLFVLVPFWTSTLVRTYAWVLILSRNGPLNSLLSLMNLPEQHLLYNRSGTIIGMTYVMLPYMVLALYPIMQAIDRVLMQASESLGASDFMTFRRIFLPLSLPGIMAGSLLVFIVSLGFFITPALLGGPRDLMVSVYIDVQVSRLLNWGLAAAVSVILLILTLLLAALLRRLTRVERMASPLGRF